MSEPTLPLLDTRERIYPRCHSIAVVRLGRVFAGSFGVRTEYGCQVCATAFWLLSGPGTA